MPAEQPHDRNASLDAESTPVSAHRLLRSVPLAESAFSALPPLAVLKYSSSSQPQAHPQTSAASPFRFYLFPRASIVGGPFFVFSPDNDNTWTQCQSATSSPSSTTCRARSSQHTIQPNTSGLSHLGNHGCLAPHLTGTSLDFAFTHGNSTPDLLASFTEPYPLLPPSSVSDPLLDGAFDAASFDLFGGLQNDPLLFALDGANTGSNYSDESPDMYNESFLAATLNPAPDSFNSFAASTQPSSKAPSSRPSPYSTAESAFSNDAPAGASSSPSGSSSSAGGKRKRAASGDEPADETLADKRRRNNLAAAKYRQKKVDRISELEDEVKEVSKERDELKLQLARRDAELELLRKLMMDRK
ncbi:b-zip transcription factor idi-4 [Diplodia corticola]|uniref:B-zip transcription factor idi-4 n=1 Tax=Diplodia corticola TaxID=236234 RepID=A0A1J9R4J6_9PEZI|nr:b-zip transcription factor idi-4 [Diplodia corticola]OJD36390.1 b-zip transcription factor idi-4 [Diplodia corticola]